MEEKNRKNARLLNVPTATHHRLPATGGNVVRALWNRLPLRLAADAEVGLYP
jgi:hypothetical protein